MSLTYNKQNLISTHLHSALTNEERSSYLAWYMTESKNGYYSFLLGIITLVVNICE